METDLPNDPLLLASVLKSAINDLTDKYKENATISFSSGKHTMRIGRFTIVSNFDINDEFKIAYIYERDEFVAAFNSFSMSLSFVLTSIIQPEL